MSDETTSRSLEKSFFIHMQDDVRLHCQEWLPADPATRQQALAAHPILCLPGLTRTHRDFSTLAASMSADAKSPRRVLCLDLRGRGLSDRADHATYTPQQEAADVLSLLTALNIGHVDIVGTSRGGIIIMALGAMRPGILHRVVLNDIGGEVDRRGLLRLKATLSGRAVPGSWDEAITIMKRMMGPEFPAFSDDDWEAFARATFADQEGKPVSDFDHGVLGMVQNFGSTTPSIALWGYYNTLRHMPHLVLRGDNSDILTAETAETMKKICGDACQLHSVPGEGHAPALHHTTLAAVSSFLNG